MNVYRIRDLSSDDHKVTDSFAGTMKSARQEGKATPVVFAARFRSTLSASNPTKRDFSRCWRAAPRWPSSGPGAAPTG